MTVLGDRVLSFSDAFKQDVFKIWYSNQKPGARKLQFMIPEDWFKDGVHEVPSLSTVNKWIREIFIPQASVLDEQVSRELEQRMVAEKVEMLSRHAKIGVKMQDTALRYIDDHLDELNTPSAVRLLVEGVRIERESRGLPQALERMMDKSDEELLEEVKKLIGESPAEIIDNLDNE